MSKKIRLLPFFKGRDIWICYNCIDVCRKTFCSEYHELYEYLTGFYSFIKEKKLFERAATWNLSPDLDHINFIWEKLLNKYSETGIIFESDVGTGKTYVLIALIRDLFIKGYYRSVKYVSEEQFFSELKSCMDPRSTRDVEDVVNKIKDIDYLFYDDLGAATRTLEGSWGKQILMEIVNHRYENKMITIYATNLNDDERFKVLGPRIADRLRTFHLIKLKGKSKRKPV